MGKKKRTSSTDQLVEWREAIGKNPALATAVLGDGVHRYTYLHLMADRPYHSAVSLQVAVLLLEHGADPNARTERGVTPLHIACQTDTREEPMVELLLRSGADPNLADAWGNAPLHFALGESEESKRIVALLLQHGARPDLDAAARLGDAGAVRRLLRRGGLGQSRRPRDLLTNAIYSGSAPTVELLLRHGADPNRAPTFSRQPPLYTACLPFWSDAAIVRLLLDYGADPNGKQYKPLSAATKNNDKMNKAEIVELLIRAGAAEQVGRRTPRRGDKVD